MYCESVTILKGVYFDVSKALLERNVHSPKNPICNFILRNLNLTCLQIVKAAPKLLSNFHHWFAHIQNCVLLLHAKFVRDFVLYLEGINSISCFTSDLMELILLHGP